MSKIVTEITIECVNTLHSMKIISLINSGATFPILLNEDSIFPGVTVELIIITKGIKGLSITVRKRVALLDAERDKELFSFRLMK